MAVTPKPARRKPGIKKSSSTLSAAEALKAAEAAVGTSPKVAPPAKSAVVKKPAAPKPSPAAKVNPAAIAAATTAVDAAPEPATPPAVEPVPSAPAPLVEEAKVEPMEVKSLSSKAGPKEPESLPATEGTKMMNDVIETGKKFAEETKVKLETAYADFNEKAKASVEKSTKAIEELSDIAKGNVEALVESGKIAAKGIETLGQDAVDYSRKSFEKATASFKSFSTVKTPTEFFQLQSQLFSSSFDELTKEAAKSSEALIKLAGDVAQPLTARVTVVTDKVKSIAA
ncbi:Phasin [Sphingobium herbicidovorans NBRC 16415]|uniref:Phasin n=1 Tax=Sphingobium herbicidovorans (strain ATCC 700291 / DSM 11019 / CCUG 56400 / KCTC 2939 / LMG 18315 / NBRC 16415 / MH) TaxID=1219045 RepID=A0A086P9V1_SPHHM|nr:phasin family protein [Sphingobium herbicidovorans]KFG90169.1 Phasin [Sphingobium herbicidovorans NBRC 16415]